MYSPYSILGRMEGNRSITLLSDIRRPQYNLLSLSFHRSKKENYKKIAFPIDLSPGLDLSYVDSEFLVY